ncbi:MAG TPA: zinc ribbon domain-containing protein, partial [Gaiellaceae bacterium]|nr:zinc ribbon domain-containing protein [Gaiellaceae bacterium]
MRACPHCGQDVSPGQEYCLGCGSRLPGRGAVGSPRDLSEAWMLRAAAALAVAIAGAALAVAASRGDGGGSELATATGGFATLPTSSTLPSPPPVGPAGTVEWPPGDDGWTIALASIPQTEGRRVAVGRAREARRRGLSTVGILDSSRYASLHPGYWVVFTGIYTSEAEATSALERA